MEVEFSSKFSLLYDTCQAIIVKTNPEGKWIDAYMSKENEKKDMGYIKNMISKIPGVDERVYLFSNLEVKKTSFLLDCYLGYLRETDGDCSVIDFCDYLGDHEKIREMLSQYYFGVESITVKEISQFCYKSELSSRLKSLIYEFLLFEDYFMGAVDKEVRYVSRAMQKIYDERAEEIEEAQKNFNMETFKQEIEELNMGDQWDEDVEKVYVSFSLWNPYVVFREKAYGDVWWILGTKYEKALPVINEEKIDLAVFGNALGDDVRQKILKAIIRNGELTVGEITKNIEGTPTTTLYHLDVLKKANIIKSRSSGRKVYCWLNEGELDLAIKAIDALKKANAKRY